MHTDRGGGVNPVLEVRSVTKHFGNVTALDDISFTVGEREVVAIVGESGSGKSTLARTILRLIDASSGEIVYRGEDLLKVNRSRMSQIRQQVQMVFQDPYASLHPRRTVEQLIGEPWTIHRTMPNKAERRARVEELLTQVGLPRNYAGYFPARLSGGERQRVAIARAMAVEPDFLVLDEPVSALDVSIQAQVIKLLMRLQEQTGFTCIFISHDLALVRLLASRVVVMYRGQIVEHGDTEAVFDNPSNDYTRLLLDSSPTFSGETLLDA